MFLNYFKYKASYLFNRLLKAYFRMLFQTLLLKKESKNGNYILKDCNIRWGFHMLC